MKMQMRLALSACLAVTACATTEPHPAKRPMTQANAGAIGETDVVLAENNAGVGKSWFYTSTQGGAAAYGLIGVLVAATMDVIINAAPASRAQRGANEVAETVTPQWINTSLLRNFESARAGGQAAGPSLSAMQTGELSPAGSAMLVSAPSESLASPPPPNGVYFGKIRQMQKITSPAPVDDAIELTTTYTLSEDAGALRVSATATYANASLTYQTPYSFKKVPKDELSGPVYRNSFLYQSDRFPTPSLSPELKERLIALAQESYKDASGALPAEGSEDYKKMMKEIEDARDNTLTKSEASIFLIREWTKDGGEPMKREIDKAHAFIAKYLLSDLNNATVPSMTNADQLLETQPDGRTVRLIGAGTPSGSYTSSPGNLDDFTTYGNTVTIAKRNNENIRWLQSQAKQAQKAAEKK